MKLLLLVPLVLATAGCISQKIIPVKPVAAEQVCIVKNFMVRSEFAEIYKAQLVRNGYSPTLVDSEELAAGCAMKSTFTATWGFHWGQYLSTADILVFKGDEMIGRATYHAPFASPLKHGRIAPKIENLVDQLFPAVAKQ
jgi:hypothetical protein